MRGLSTLLLAGAASALLLLCLQLLPSGADAFMVGLPARAGAPARSATAVDRPLKGMAAVGRWVSVQRFL